MKQLVTIATTLLIIFYVSSTNADEPKVSSQNQWVKNYNKIRQGQPYMIKAFDNYYNRPVRTYRRPHVSYHYYYKPMYIQNNYIYQRIQNNYYKANGFGSFMMNLPTQ